MPHVRGSLVAGELGGAQALGKVSEPAVHTKRIIVPASRPDSEMMTTTFDLQGGARLSDRKAEKSSANAAHLLAVRAVHPNHLRQVASVG